MTTFWRVDYAALEHSTWLSMETELYSSVEDAVRQAQRRSERWERCAGWRIAKMTVPAFEKIRAEDIGKTVDELGQHLMPWSLKPWPGRERRVARAA